MTFSHIDFSFLWFLQVLALQQIESQAVYRLNVVKDFSLLQSKQTMLASNSDGDTKAIALNKILSADLVCKRM